MSLRYTTILAILLACIAFAQSKDCLKACTLEYDPICASNGKEFQIFGNLCAFEVANCEENSVWTKAHSMAYCQADTTDIAAEPNCEKPCTFDLNPVCGFNGETHQVFDNVCQMENAHCMDNKVWFQTLMTECVIPINSEKNCNTACTLEYNPVCGFNGEVHQVFGNPCALKNAHCQDGKTWVQTLITDCKIPVAIKYDCTRPCTREYNPVCGSNGEEQKLFGNPCEFKNAHCQDGKTWSEMSLTDCLSPAKIDTNCEVPCTREYMPVCGYNGEEHKVFSNGCLLKNAHCKDGRTWYQTVMNDCFETVNVKDECTTFCTREYNPVCGFNGEEHKLFGNPCEFKNAHCADGKTWSKMDFTDCLIPAKVENICEVPCTREYMPVCGFNGEEHHVFSNACELKNAHCKDTKTWSQVVMASCLARTSFDNICEKPCTRELSPVCGFNGARHQIFSNRCVMENEHCNDGKQWTQTRFDDCEVQQIFAADNQKLCEVPCTREYSPVCGYNGKINKVFGNKCVMDNEHCKDGQTWSETLMSECSFRGPSDSTNDCPQICPLIYAPTCGFDGVTYHTFSNLCEMEVSNCNKHTNFLKVNLDKCMQTIEPYGEKKEVCPTICPMIYAPTCGFDGITYHTFSNLCEMEVSNCNKHTNFLKVNLDKCMQAIEPYAAKIEDCPTICPMIYAPTCGFDGANHKLFSSPCDMKVFNCNKHTNYLLSRLSDCQA